MHLAKKLAVCLTGLIRHGSRANSSLVDRAQLDRLEQWAATIRKGGHLVDFFMYVELHDYPPKQTERKTMRYVESSTEPRRATPPHELAAPLSRLRPVKLALHDEQPLCSQPGNNCGCTGAWPRWMETMLKANRCARLIETREQEVKIGYDWVMSMRSDLDVDNPWHRASAEHVLATVSAAAPAAMVFVHPSGPAPGYGQIDWFWVAQRRAALMMASVVTASCDWLRCVWAAENRTVRLVRKLVGLVMQNERLLVEWALAHDNMLVSMPRSVVPWPSAQANLTGVITRATHPSTRRCDGLVLEGRRPRGLHPT